MFQRVKLLCVSIIFKCGKRYRDDKCKNIYSYIDKWTDPSWNIDRKKEEGMEDSERREGVRWEKEEKKEKEKKKDFPWE